MLEELPPLVVELAVDAGGFLVLEFRLEGRRERERPSLLSFLKPL